LLVDAGGNSLGFVFVTAVAILLSEGPNFAVAAQSHVAVTRTKSLDGDVPICDQGDFKAATLKRHNRWATL
jgi:hypothetical protein